MGAELGGNMNANSGNYNYYTEYSKVSFDGFINENYFSIDNQETFLVENIDITHAITKNPITYKKDAFIGLFLKSKYDGIGNRHPIDMSIALDISGSMSVCDEVGQKSRISLAKESLKKLVSIMDENNDKMSLITFNHETEKIFGLLNKNDITKKFLHDVDAIKSRGGTDLVLALTAAMENFDMNNNEKKEKRIIMITDAAYTDVNDELFLLFKQCVEEEGISITIMAISSESNLILADKVSHFKGCNYFPIVKSSDLEDFLVNNFNYVFFPIAYDTTLKIKSDNAKIIKCIGGENEIVDEFNNTNNENEAPNPSNEVIFNLGSVFSSDLKKVIDNYGIERMYSKGGLILLKVNPDDLNKNEDLKFNFTLEYTTFDNMKSSQNYSYTIPSQKDNNEFFKDNNIRKGIAIYYFAATLNHLVEVQNKTNAQNKYQNQNTMIDENKKQKDLRLVETKQVIEDYLRKNFVLESNNDATRSNLNNYMNLIKNRYEGFKKVIFAFYHLYAPLPYSYY
jgi:hypothetical protein